MGVAFLTASELGLANHVLHCPYLRSMNGAEVRRWSVNELRPAVMYLHQNEVVDSFFGGLLFEADTAWSGEGVSSKTLGFGRPGSLTAWQQALDDLFLPGFNMDAALQVSRQRPFQKLLDIWVALPYPQPAQQAFGLLDGRMLNFRVQEDRITALKWWVDQVVTRYYALSQLVPGHLGVLRGFAWTKSSLSDEDEALASAIAKHVHAHGLKLMWIQNYVSGKALSGYNMGFDLILMRPTYLGIPPRDEKWVRYASMLAEAYRFGMTMWGEERINPRQILDLMNIGQADFMHAYQTYELPYSRILDWYVRNDPLYVYLYAYTKGAFAKIPG